MPTRTFAKADTEKGDFLSRCGVLLSVGTAILTWLRDIFTLWNSEYSKNASKKHLEKEKRKR